MFKQIVVGVDGHEGGRDAIALAKHLRARDGELTLAHVLAHDGHGYRGPSASYEAAGWASAAELLEKVRDEAGVDAHLRWQVSGSVGAPCAIAIAPTCYSRAAGAMRAIGVGYNASPESRRALELARRIAAGTGARLSAFEAVSIPAIAFEVGVLPVSDMVRAQVNEAMERISALGGVEAHVAYGDAAEELALYSASLDLLVVGSRGYGPIGRLIHGSTSRKLTHMARCPLLVLPRSARAIEASEAEETGREPALAAND